MGTTCMSTVVDILSEVDVENREIGRGGSSTVRSTITSTETFEKANVEGREHEGDG